MVGGAVLTPVTHLFAARPSAKRPLHSPPSPSSLPLPQIPAPAHASACRLPTSLNSLFDPHPSYKPTLTCLSPFPSPSLSPYPSAPLLHAHPPPFCISSPCRVPSPIQVPSTAHGGTRRLPPSGRLRAVVRPLRNRRPGRRRGLAPAPLPPLTLRPTTRRPRHTQHVRTLLVPPVRPGCTAAVDGLGGRRRSAGTGGGGGGGGGAARARGAGGGGRGTGAAGKCAAEPYQRGGGAEADPAAAPEGAVAGTDGCVCGWGGVCCYSVSGITCAFSWH